MDITEEEMTTKRLQAEFEQKLALMNATIRMVATGVTQCVAEAVVDNLITEDRAEALCDRFQARTAESLADLIEALLKKMGEAKAKASIIAA